MAVRHDRDPKALTAARRREAAKPGRNKTMGRGSGLTPTVMRAVQILVHGLEENPGASLSRKAAAELAGMQERSFELAFKKPAVQAYFHDEMALLRLGERPGAIRKIAAIVKDEELIKKPSGARVVLDAAKSLAFDPPGHVVNVQVNTAVKMTPGYVIRIDRSRDERGQQIEHLAQEGDDHG